MVLYRISIFCLVLLTVISSSELFSQEIPNGDFELWENRAGLNMPTNWNGTTADVFYDMQFRGLIQDTLDSFSGSSCIKLITMHDNNGDDDISVPGLLSLSNVFISAFTYQLSIGKGIPFPYYPDKLRGYYKYYPISGDSSSIEINIRHNNELIDSGTLIIKDSVTDWTLFEINLNNISGIVPDSVNVVCRSSSGQNLQLGSILKIDSLSFIYNDNYIQENIIIDDVSTYPNPASEVLKFESKLSFKILRIFDSYGRNQNIIIVSEKDKSISIDISELDTGFYYVEIQKRGRTEIKKIVIY